MTLVGDRGIMLSGGQCERLGLARALYKQTNVLVLDESTNALGLGVEQAFMHFLGNGFTDMNVIMVSHSFGMSPDYYKQIFMENGCLEGFEQYKSVHTIKINSIGCFN